MNKNVIDLYQLNNNLNSIRMCSIKFPRVDQFNQSPKKKKAPNRLSLIQTKVYRSHSDLLKLITPKGKIENLSLVIYNKDDQTQEYSNTRKESTAKKKFIRTKSGKIFRGVRFRNTSFVKTKLNNALYDDKLFKEEKQIDYSGVMNNNINEYYKQYEVEKPFQLAGTIYKELSKQKALFFQKLRSTQNVEAILKITQPTNVSNRSQKKKTCLLDRKFKGAIPMNLPVFISYNQQYDTMSEKRRHEKIMETFLKLKSYIDGKPEESLSYIKEFLLENGVYIEEVNSYEKLTNFLHFIHENITIDPKKSFQKIIQDAMNYKTNYEFYSKEKDDEIEEIGINSNRNNVINKSKYSTINFANSLNNKTIFKERKEKEIVKYIDQEKFNLKINQKENAKDIKSLIHDLESELSLLQTEKYKKISSMKNLLCSRPKKKEFIEDTNTYVPNLCLSNLDINLNLINKAKEKKEKAIKRANLQCRIREINNRMYYNNIYNSKNDVDYIDMRRKNKLTEFIILERAKKTLSIENCKKLIGANDNLELIESN